jgi:hypothetical protein
LYSARIANGYTFRDNFGMWVKLNAAPNCPLVLARPAVEYPSIGQFSLMSWNAGHRGDETGCDGALVECDEIAEVPAFATVGEVLTWARTEIARLSGMPSDAIHRFYDESVTGRERMRW